MTKFVFVTGGVVSSLGKGIASASLAAILESRGLKVTLIKLDPYLNVDPGTMSPVSYTHLDVYKRQDIHHLALITRASRYIARSPCLAAPSIRFLFTDKQFTFHASFPHSVTLMQLRLTSLVVINLRRDLHP